MGWGFLESVYRRAMLVALADAGAQARTEVPLPIYFRGQRVGDYRADLIVDGQVIVEVKAVQAISPAHRAQLLNYLKATRIERGLLLNFGPRPQFERMVFANHRKEPKPIRI